MADNVIKQNKLAFDKLSNELEGKFPKDNFKEPSKNSILKASKTIAKYVKAAGQHSKKAVMSTLSQLQKSFTLG